MKPIIPYIKSKRNTSQIDLSTKFPKLAIELDDTARFQRAINYAISNNVKLVSNKSHTFIISSPIEINNFIDIDLGGATIKANGNLTSMFHIDNRNGQSFADTNKTGRISNIDFDCGTSAIGISATYLSKTELDSIKFKNLVGTAIKIDGGFEVICNKWDIVASGTNSVGIEINTSDCHFTDIIMLGCYKAIKNNGSNVYTRVHAWLLSTNSVGSTFFDHVSGDAYLLACCSDTITTVINKQTADHLLINELKVIWNMSQYPSTSATIFNFTNADDSSNVSVTNSRFHASTGLTNAKISNITDNSTLHIKGLIGTNFFDGIQGMDNMDVSSLTLTSGFSLGSNPTTNQMYNRLIRKGNVVRCEGKIVSSTPLTAGTEYTFGNMPSNHRYDGTYIKIVPVLLSADPWGASFDIGWAWVGSTSILVKHNSSKTNLTYISYCFEYDVPYYY